MHLDPELKVAVIGDVMLDAYIFGEVSRISPEAPVPVMEVRQRKVTLGGAGNVALNLAGLGARVLLFGVVGDDRDGRLVSGMLRDHGIEDRLHRDERVPTIVKTRLVANNQQLMRFDEEVSFNGHGPGCPLNGIAGIIESGVSAVVLSDYDKGVIYGPLTAKVMEICKRMGVPVLADPKSGDWEAFRGADLVKPNLSELSRAAGDNPRTYDEVAAAARRMALKYELKAVLVTMGSRGMMLVNEHRRELIPTSAKEVFDVSGAGDTAIAVLAACLGSGQELSDAARLANIAAGIVVGKFGTQPISINELRDVP